MKESKLENTVRKEMIKHLALGLLPGYHTYFTLKRAKENDPAHRKIHYIGSLIFDSLKLGLYSGTIYKLFF